MERRPAQRPFRIRIQILVGAWLSQHGASDMPVEPSPLMLWSELLIQIFETVAQREYLVRWVTEHFHSAADERHGDLVGRIGMAAIRFPVPLPNRTGARRRHQRGAVRIVALHQSEERSVGDEG